MLVSQFLPHPQPYHTSMIVLLFEVFPFLLASSVAAHSYKQAYHSAPCALGYLHTVRISVNPRKFPKVAC